MYAILIIREFRIHCFIELKGGIGIDKYMSMPAIDSELRRRAEDLLKTQMSEAVLPQNDRETLRLLHELQVHQIELEMQNEELKNAKDELESVLFKYSDLYDFAPVGYFTLDRTGIINSVNLRGASLVGVARGRLLGQRFERLVADEYRQKFNDYLGTVFTTPDKTECEVALRNDENRLFIVLLEAMATVSGQECGLVLKDITDRKQAEESLIKSENRYHRITEGLTDYLYTVRIENGQAMETTQSNACLRVTGYTQEEFVSNPFLWIQMVEPEDRNVVKARVRQLLAGVEIPPMDHRIIRKDGEIRWVRDTTIMFKDVHGNLISYDGLIQDITERKQAEVDLRSYASRLIVMEEQLRYKIATELHDEICRDLTVLGMNLSIIGDGIADLVPKKLSARVNASAKLTKGMSQTVRSIMVGLRPPVLDDYGLLASLRWHADLFSKRNGIAVKFQLEEPIPRFLLKKETALFRIVQESLMNVVKHAATRAVTIKLRSADGMLWIAVVDEGNGYMPAVPLHNPNGCGWGMRIMREQAELLGGIFQVISTPGKGTTISVTMPLEDI